MSMSMESFKYPPKLSKAQLSNRIFNVKDYQITHGMLLKYGPDANSVHGVPVGVSLFPSLFPEKSFKQAQELQTVYNRLYAAVSQDEEWLGGVLEGIVRDDEFAAKLWKIHQEVKREGFAQHIHLGLFRSDYMIHVSQKREETDSRTSLDLKQIEFNTFSVAGGAHSNKTAELQQHLLKIGAHCISQQSDENDTRTHVTLLENKTIESLVSGLALGYVAYGIPKSGRSSQKCILFVVQPRNMNICDERPLEYTLWDHNPPIPAFRAIFGEEVLAHTTITPSRELLYQSPSSSTAFEVAVVYMRAGYDAEEYTPAGCAARLRLERSQAIKCPSILCHLATFKKVQQALARPDALNRFLTLADATAVEKTFAPMYPLDNESDAGRDGRALARNPKTAVNFVLKPSLEGGGHNVYRGDIPVFLKSVPESRWHTFILMQLVNPLVQRNILLSPRGRYPGETDEENYAQEGLTQLAGPTVSELGIFGVCLWKTKDQGGIQEILENFEAGWSFKTKPREVDEMSVVKGYGCFDCPYLFDQNIVLLANQQHE